CEAGDSGACASLIGSAIVCCAINRYTTRPSGAGRRRERFDRASGVRRKTAGRTNVNDQRAHHGD
ncbi:MAG: hypothetical protein WAK04_17705, partial [Xanthobacteraceae bacterium]